MNRANRKSNTDKKNVKDNTRRNHTSVVDLPLPLKEPYERYYTFRSSLRNSSTIPIYYSLSDLKNYITIPNYLPNVKSFRKNLAFFLQTRYCKYLTHDPENKRPKILKLLTLLESNDDPKISYKNFAFLKSLVNEKEAKKETDIQK